MTMGEQQRNEFARQHRFTNTEKHKAALNEVYWRRRVYERSVNTGARSRESAEKRIAVMEEIAADYAELAKKDRLL